MAFKLKLPKLSSSASGGNGQAAARKSKNAGAGKSKQTPVSGADALTRRLWILGGVRIGQPLGSLWPCLRLHGR